MTLTFDCLTRDHCTPSTRRRLLRVSAMELISLAVLLLEHGQTHRRFGVVIALFFTSTKLLCRARLVMGLPTGSTQPCIPPWSQNQVHHQPWLAEVKVGMTLLPGGMQVTLRDPVWRESSCSSDSVAESHLHVANCYILPSTLLTYRQTDRQTKWETQLLSQPTPAAAAVCTCSLAVVGMMGRTDGSLCVYTMVASMQSLVMIATV